MKKLFGLRRIDLPCLPLKGKPRVHTIAMDDNNSLTPFAQKLRKNMTKEERRLWYDFLKQLPQNFNRQKVIGSYIVDFYCAEAKLVIELDGSQHYEDNGVAADSVRDEYMRSLGLTVCRYQNCDVMQNFEGVCTDILLRLDSVE